MSRWAPVVTTLYFDGSGGLTIEWDLDHFYDDPDEPDSVFVTIQSGWAVELAGSQRTYTLPADIIASHSGTQLVGQVIFKWIGPPDEMLASPFTIGLSKAGAADTPTSNGPSVPRLTMSTRQPKTLRTENLITLHWSSWNVNYGRITWGPMGSPTAHTHTFEPRKDDGIFTTDHPLAGGTIYQFLVRVENTHHGTSAESTISIRSADNYRSLRSFLLASGLNIPIGLTEHLSTESSLRALMGA